MNTEPGDELRVQLAETHVAVSDYFSGLSPEEAVHRLDPEAWRPVDDLRHLTLATRALTRGVSLPPAVLAERFGAFEGESRRCSEITAEAGAALAKGATSPDPFVPPMERPEESATLVEDAVAAWRAAARELETALVGWSEEDLDRYRLPHPFLGPLTLREWLCFNHIHARHHIRVAKRRLGRGD